MKKTTVKDFLFLHFVLLVYAGTSILSKYASSKSGIAFFALYGGVLFSLLIYAVLWQLVLKKFKLTVAFANKAIVVVWGIVWGYLLFGEAISLNKIVGAIIIIIGILIVVKSDEQ